MAGAGNGISDATDLPVTWSLEKNIVWKAALPSWSGGTPIIWGDRVFVTSPSEPATVSTEAEAPRGLTARRRRPRRRTGPQAGSAAALADLSAHAATLAARSFAGLSIENRWRKLWRRELDEGNRTWKKQNAHQPSPVTDGKHVWVVTGTGAVAAFDMDGDEVWQAELQAEYGDSVSTGAMPRRQCSTTAS